MYFRLITSKFSLFLHKARFDTCPSNCYFSSQEEDYARCAQESSRIESLYGHFFDATIVNENIDIAYEELLATMRVFSTGKHWVPSNWVI